MIIQFLIALTNMNMPSEVRFGNFSNVKERLQTFSNWSKVQSPQSLADAGFFRIPQYGPDDVQCFYCGIKIFAWEPSDEPLAEHLKWSRHCKFANLKKHVRLCKYLINEFCILHDELENITNSDYTVPPLPNVESTGGDICGNNGVADGKHNVNDNSILRWLLTL